MAGETSKRHHVVSRGLQRNWATDDRVQLIFKAERRAEVISIDKALVKSHFNSVMVDTGVHDDQLEREWSRLEGAAFPVISSFLSSERPFDAEVDLEIKVMLTMHLVRSFSTRALHDAIVGEFGPGFVDQMMKNRTVQRRWAKQHGGPIDRDALERMVQELLDDHTRANDLFPPRQVAIFNQLLEEYRPRHVQIVASHSDRIPFVLGDVPAVAVSGIRVGNHNGVGLKAAERIRMPLSPRFGVVLRRDVPDEHKRLSASQTQLWNRDSWRCSLRFLVAPVGVDWKRAIAL